MKLACIGPLSPLRTGVADFTERLLPYLSERCDITLFTDGYAPSRTPILSKYAWADIEEYLSEPSAFDATLYHMGNHYRYHRRVFEALARVPGVVLLHDCVLNQFFAKYALERGRFETFRGLFELCYPGHADTQLGPFFEGRGEPYRYPMAGAVALCARGTIVMNEYARNVVLREAANAAVAKVNFPYFESGREAVPREIPRKWGIPASSYVIVSVGHITPAKRIDVAVRAFRKLRETYRDSYFLLAGEMSGRACRADFSADDNIRYLGYLEASELDALMTRADVCINLRYPSNGEMSMTLMEMLGRGKPVIVSNYAQFAEFPDETCIKVDLGPNESDDLAERLLELSCDKELRRKIGEAARAHVGAYHSPREAADSIVKFIEERSRAAPVLSRDKLAGILQADGPLSRHSHMIRYNIRRLLAYMREYGMAHTLREGVRRTRV
ncbi:MAG: glycosyltransferase family 4 protein [Candidatus Abyssubacteria bacterium]